MKFILLRFKSLFFFVFRCNLQAALCDPKKLTLALKHVCYECLCWRIDPFHSSPRVRKKIPRRSAARAFFPILGDIILAKSMWILSRQEMVHSGCAVAVASRFQNWAHKFTVYSKSACVILKRIKTCVGCNAIVMGFGTWCTALCMLNFS